MEEGVGSRRRMRRGGSEGKGGRGSGGRAGPCRAAMTAEPGSRDAMPHISPPSIPRIIRVVSAYSARTLTRHASVLARQTISPGALTSRPTNAPAVSFGCRSAGHRPFAGAAGPPTRRCRSRPWPMYISEKKHNWPCSSKQKHKLDKYVTCMYRRLFLHALQCWFVLRLLWCVPYVCVYYLLLPFLFFRPSVRGLLHIVQCKIQFKRL